MPNSVNEFRGDADGEREREGAPFGGVSVWRESKSKRESEREKTSKQQETQERKNKKQAVRWFHLLNCECCNVG